ncbi:MAG: cytochrome C oxidase subunit IV family protein [Caenibius sp.]
MNQPTTQRRLPFRPATMAWALLMIATAIGWWFGETAQGETGNVRLAIAGVLVTAFAKAWIVGFQFMELRGAPRPLRHAFDAWVVVACTALSIICLR